MADPVVPSIPRPRPVNVALLIVFRHLPANTLIVSTMVADVMELVGVILLFTGPSSRWFKQPRSVIH